MNTHSALTYRFTLAVLLLVAARGLYHTVNIFLSGGVHIPVLAIILICTAAPGLLHSFTERASEASQRICLQVIMFSVGLSSWVPMTMTIDNWGFMTFLNFGIGLLLLSNKSMRSDKSALYFVYGNMTVQLLVFGVMLPAFDVHSNPNGATASFALEGTWLSLSFLYVCSGLIGVLTIRSKDEQISAITKEQELKDQLHKIYNHNLKTPLQTISMQVKLLNLRFGEDSSTAIIEQNVDEISERILTLLSIDRIPTQYKEFSNRDLVEILFQKYQKEVHFYDNLENSKIQVTQLLELALENFIENAIKFSMTQPNLYFNEYHGGVHIRLIDDGIGMNSQMLEKYGTRTTSKSGGSGIGVYLSIKLLQEAGYQIKVQSIEHQGTAIDIYQNGNLDRLQHASRNTKMFC